MRAEALRRRDLCSDPLLDLDSDDDEAELELAMLGKGPKLEYRVHSTGACVNFCNAKSLLFYFCNKLPSDRWVWSSPSYVYWMAKFVESKATCCRQSIYLPYRSATRA